MTTLFNSNSDRLAFLSNFYMAPFVAQFRGHMILFRSTEHYYQAHKTKDIGNINKILTSVTGAKAKYFGSAKSGCIIVEGFDDKRSKIMYKAVRYKFAQNPLLWKLLKQTKGKLVEDAPWDDYFGSGRDGNGKNVLGNLLTVLRDSGFEDMGDYRPKVKLKLIYNTLPE